MKSFVMTSERTFVYTTYQFWDGILNSTGVKHLHDFAILQNPVQSIQFKYCITKVLRYNESYL